MSWPIWPIENSPSMMGYSLINMARPLRKINIFTLNRTIAPLMLLFLVFCTFNPSFSQEVSQILNQGNTFFTQGEYGKAWANYESVLLLDNNNSAARNKISQIQNKLKDKQVIMTLFEQNITSGAKFLDAKDYKQAHLAYSAAKLLRPESQYPIDKLREIEKLYADPVIEKGYNNALTRGNTALAANNYQQAKLAFEQALAIKPNEHIPSEKIQEIDAIVSQSEGMRTQYNELIATADNLFGSGDQEKALESYKQASSLFPSESYPQQRIKIISETLKEEQATEALYQQKITDADNLYMSQKYDLARKAYEEARNIKITENYPSSMIARIDEALLKQKSSQQQYLQLVKEADVLHASGNIAGATAKYKQASALFPNEEYPKDRLREIEEQAAADIANEKAYSEALSNGDNAYNTNNYEDALAHFATAMAMKPNEDYARNKIAEINGLMAEKEAKENSYQQILDEGNTLFNKKEFASALGKFRTAAQLRPNDDIPASKIKEIETIIDQAEKNRQEYGKIIAKADKNFRTGNYDEALIEYTKAKEILPEEKYPGEQIENINRKRNDDIALQQSQYDNLVVQAEQKATNESYGEAIALYSQAKEIFPDNEKADARIKELNEKIAVAGQRDQAFDKIIARADTQLKHEEYANALTTYNEALKIKANASYAVEKIKEINAIIENLEKEKRKRYDDYIQQGDISFSKEAYSKALHAYSGAAELYPDEEYPAKKIQDLQSLIGETERTEASYMKAIATAEKLVKEESWNEALKAFQEAGEIKPEEAYPKLQIMDISNKLAKIQQTNNQYNNRIKEADKLYAALQFDEAAAKYQESLSIKPDEAYPAQQIREIEALKKDITGKAQAYDSKIEVADRFYKEEKYEKAKNEYTEAAALKPLEEYPKQQLATIEGILKEREAQATAYNEAIKTADDLLAGESFTEAIAAYQQALVIAPGDEYATRKISAAEKILQNQSSKQDQYSKIITKADLDFTNKDYRNAVNKYTEASELLPDEEYPKTKIAEANDQLSLIEQQKRIEYEKTIETADGFFTMGQYSSALENYRKARQLLSFENYPKEKIQETEAIILEQKSALMGDYLKQIATADSYYKSKKYASAIQAYEKAGKLNTGEQYPFTMINNIKEIIGRQVAVEVTTTKALIPAKEGITIDFTPLHYSQKKNNYLIITARNAGEGIPKVFVSFGEKGQKNGGVVLSNIESQDINQYIVPLNTMDRWYRADNNWVKIYCETGSIEIVSVRISNIIE